MSTPALENSEPVQKSGSYRAWQLAARSPGVVDLAWYSRSHYGAREQHHLLPFTEPSIALRRRFGPGGETTDWDFVIFRAQPDGGSYAPRHGEDLYALRLAPEAMETGLGMSARDHLAEDCEVPGKLSRKFDRVARCADNDDFVGAWQAMLVVLGTAASDVELDRIDLAASLARNSCGMLGPGELAARAGLSARHMRRGFADRLGLSPRAVLRRRRLTTAMLAAERSDQPAWADIAAGHSFADQSHMIRECRALIGTSPAEWHRQRRIMAVSFNTQG